jgi:diguanylate cyclase (GGDEF)-like protein
MDALTGLRNHGTFREELHEAMEAGQPFALLMLDLDDFKSYNDRHGHESGNMLLSSIAEAIRACRDSDQVYRYGGDEFSTSCRARLSGRRHRGRASAIRDVRA